MRTYSAIHNGIAIEVWKSEEQEYVQKGQFCYFRKVTDWCLKVNGTFYNRGFGTKRAALAYGKSVIDRFGL